VFDSLKSKMSRWAGVRIILLLTVSVIMVLNSMDTKSLLIGIPASLVFLFICSVATSEIFFPHERRFVKQTLGLAAFVLIIALLGTFLILIVNFTETLSLISLTVVGLILCFLSRFKKHKEIQETSTQPKKSKNEDRESYLLVFPFLLSVAIGFYELLLARTGEGQVSVWLTIPSFFLPVFLFSSLCLVTILFFTKINVGLKLALISLHSFLSHSVFSLVWYPGRYGDTWSYLGNARYIDVTGSFYAYKWLYSQRLIADIIKYQAHYGLVIFFRRMFSLDIYWVHVFFIPLLWSLFVPIFFYKIAELLAVKKNTSFPLFCAIGSNLFSPLIYWGAISTAYSLGLLLLLFSITLLLYWVNTRTRRILFLSLLASVATLFAHPQAGVFAFSFFFVAVIIQGKLPRILKLILFAMTFVAYPYVSYLHNATFSLKGLLSLENFLSFQLDITTLLLIFGFVGLLFGVRSKLLKGKGVLMLFLFYATVAANYYVSMYGMQNAPVPQRILTLADILLVPFVAQGFMITADFLKDGLSQVKANFLKNAARFRSVATFIICMFLSLLLTSAIYQAYPRQEITEVQPAAYELEAIQYIDSTSEGRYVVLGDTNLAGLAGGFLGIDYSYGCYSAKGIFGIPEWDYWNMKLYQQMLRNPSLSVLEEAMSKANVGISYFVVSKREPNYKDIVRRTSEVLQANRTFGEGKLGKLTVFRYSSGTLPITGFGPVIQVAFDGGSFTEVQTEYEYFSKSKVKYIIRLSDHSSYNITDYPTYWTFLNLTVNGVSTQFHESSDVNTFIYITGVDPGNALEVVWQANDYYPYAGWKEDSFKYSWQTHPLYAESGLPHIVTKDGNTLTISGNFTHYTGRYAFYYQSKKVNNISTNDFPYVLVKWKSTGPVASVIVSYTDGAEEQIVPYGGQSSERAVSIVKLEPHKEIAYVIVGVTNIPDFTVESLQTLYVDYVLVCAPE